MSEPADGSIEVVSLDHHFSSFLDAPQRRSPPRGIESQWTELCTLAVPSGELAVADPMLVFDDLLWVELPAGEYTVSAKVVRYPDDRRVSRLRVLRSRTAHQGVRLGGVSVDCAQVCVCDRQLGLCAFPAWDHETGQRYVAGLDEFRLAGLVRHSGHAPIVMPIVSSGWGDSHYPVLELLRGSTRVGIELAFITLTA